jgi:hypothetical protein
MEIPINATGQKIIDALLDSDEISAARHDYFVNEIL